MGFTNFPNGLTSFGMPVIPGIGYVPWGHDQKFWFVAPYRGTSNGASDSHRGDDPRRPLKTVAAAYAKARENKNDVIFMFASGDSATETTDDLDATLTWAKDLVHLIGVGGAGTMFGHRSRFNTESGATGVTPMIDVTASSCHFANFQLFSGGGATNLIALQVSGNHNSFHNLHIAGMGHADNASAANAASLKLNGGTENVFRNCVIGVDTISQDGDSKGQIWLDGGASRMWFYDCLIQNYVSDTDAFHVTIEDTTAIDRWLGFTRCKFLAKSTNAAVTQASVFSIPAGISQGAIILEDSKTMSDGGAIDWDTGDRNIIWNNHPAPEAAGVGGIMTTQ